MTDTPRTPWWYSLYNPWWGLLLALLMLGGALFVYLNHTHRQITANEQERIVSHLDIITDNLTRQLQIISQTMAVASRDPGPVMAVNDGAGLNEQLDILALAMPAIRTLLLIDKDGNVKASNRPELMDRNFAYRDYFQITRRLPEPDRLYVSAPFETVLGVYAFNVTRALYGTDGEFLGIISATLAPEFLETLLVSVLHDADMINTVSHTSGGLIMSRPHADNLPQGAPAYIERIVNRHTAGSSLTGIFIEPRSNGLGTRMIAMATLNHGQMNLENSLVLSVSRDMGAIYQDWYSDLYMLGGFYLLFSLTTAIGLRTQIRHLREAKTREDTGRQALARSNERFDLATETAGIGVWEYEVPSGRLYWNRIMHEIYGIPETDEPSMLSTWENAVHPDDRPGMETAVAHCMETGEPFHRVFRIRRPDGSVRYIDASAKMIYEVGQADRMIGTNQDITERCRIDSELIESRAELQEAQRIADFANWKLDLESGTVEWSTGLYRMLGLDPSLSPPDFNRHQELFTPESWQRLSSSLERTRLHGEPYELELEMVRTDGSHGWMLSRGEAIRDPLGNITGLHGVAADITRRRQADESLKLAASVFTSAREGIMITDVNNVIIDVNEAFTRITGYEHGEVVGMNPAILHSGHQGRDFYGGMWEAIRTQDYWSGEIWNRRKNGEVYAEMLTISVVRDDHDNVSHYVAVFSDISDLKQHQKELEYLAHFDALTGLPNRTLLSDRLHQAMAQSLRRKTRLAVVFIDLDDFKSVNDQYGHDIGDQLLTQLSTRMKQSSRETDTVSRLGGDEFLAVLQDLHGEDDITPLLDRLLQDITRPITLDEGEFTMAASLGVTFFPQEQDVDADQLIRQADQAMYQAKLSGKNRYYFFDTEAERSLRGMHENLNSVSQALQHGEMLLHYQPKVNMRDGRILGAEALVRWQHPERGLLSPASFLPVIEGNPLAVALDEWVIGQVLGQMEAWRAVGLDLNVSINISPDLLQMSDFDQRLKGLLESHAAISPSCLELEVLETSALGDLNQVASVINACKELGVVFSMDDFGTGYSSLTYLKRLDADIIKIDQSFVRGITHDPDSLSILEGIVGLAGSFRRQVIAEGVESLEHGQLLLYLGCDQGQGYGIGEPMAADELAAWISRWQPDLCWTETRPLSVHDVQLLYGFVALNAWIHNSARIIQAKGRLLPPPEAEQSSITRWLIAREQCGEGQLPAVSRIRQLYETTCELTAALYESHLQGDSRRTAGHLDRLQVMHGELLAAFNDVSRRHQATSPRPQGSAA